MKGFLFYLFGNNFLVWYCYAVFWRNQIFWKKPWAILGDNPNQWY